jgi:endonuclease/exonuclease/phosphatase family metal-dependent hydrolase
MVVVCSWRVMSYNVRGASHMSDGVNLWDERAGLNVETIRRHGPDLIGIQEAQGPNLEVYERELSGYARLPGPVYGTGQVEEFAAILYDPGRFEALDAGGFWLSDTPEEYSASWGNEVVRSANWAVLRCRESGGAFLHANTHLDHVSEPARRGQPPHPQADGEGTEKPRGPTHHRHRRLQLQAWHPSLPRVRGERFR